MKPILFNTQMVRAILDGEKTCTRRLVKLPKHIEQQSNGLYTLSAEGSVYIDRDFKEVVDYIKLPYKVGDILYVRETWANVWLPDGQKLPTAIYKADGKPENFPYWGNAKQCKSEVWIPSIHMPKIYARIFLRVTSVKAERLQDIDEEQAKKEGARKISWYQPFGTKIEDEQKYIGSLVNHEINYKTGFADIWDSTVKEDKYSWEGNPWVWVIEFERVEKGE